MIEKTSKWAKYNIATVRKTDILEPQERGVGISETNQPNYFNSVSFLRYKVGTYCFFR